MNSTTAVNRRRESALERLKKSGKTDQSTINQINILQERVVKKSKHRKYLRRKPGVRKMPVKAPESTEE